VKFGVLYNIDYRPEVHRSPSGYYGQILDQVQLLEELGFDAVWFGEHHYSGYSFGNPAVIATAAAARTKRIRLGTGVALIPLHHPIRLAEEYAMLDVLSGGRLDFGVGRGFLYYAYDIFGVDMEQSHQRYREGMDLILQAWTADRPFSYDGQFWKLKDYQFFPQPVQKPHPRVFAAGAGTPASFEWAGSRGLHLCTAFFGPDKLGTQANIRLYRKALATGGYDPASREVVAVSQMYCAQSKAEAVRLGGQYATNYYRFFASLDRLGSRSILPQHFSRVSAEELDAANLVLLGDPDDLVTRIEEIRNFYGIDFLLMEIAQGGAPNAEVVRAMELFARHVIPKFRGDGES